MGLISWTAATFSDETAASSALIEDPVMVLATLLGVLAILFWANRAPGFNRLFRLVPLLVFAYFVPTLLSNTGVIPLKSPLYDFVKSYLLPCSLILLVLAVDIPAILGLGRNAVILFLASTATVIIGGPLAYLCLGWFVPAELGEQAWKGLGALSGSWIGGGANFVAVGDSIDASDTTISMMVVIDVAVAEIWTIVLFFYAGRQQVIDDKIGADRSSIDAVRDKITAYQAQVSRPTNLTDLLAILAIAFGVTTMAKAASGHLPEVGNVLTGTTWVIFLCTTIALILSFTPVRRLEGAGASAVGSVFLYLLVTVIGAKAKFSDIIKYPELVAVAGLWMVFHVVIILWLRRWLKAPIFFAAVGSKANIGGAASAPIVAAAFHPALAPVGVLLALGGYVLGTYGGILCALLLEMVHNIVT